MVKSNEIISDLKAVEVIVLRFEGSNRFHRAEEAAENELLQKFDGAHV